MREWIHQISWTSKKLLFQNGPVCGGAMEPAGHAWAQSLQSFAIFTSSDVCANFVEFSSIPNLSKMKCRRRIIIIFKNIFKNNKFPALSVPGTVEPWHFRAEALIIWHGWFWCKAAGSTMANHTSSYMIQLQHKLQHRAISTKNNETHSPHNKLNRNGQGQPVIDIRGICWAWTYDNRGRSGRARKYINKINERKAPVQRADFLEEIQELWVLLRKWMGQRGAVL